MTPSIVKMDLRNLVRHVLTDTHYIQKGGLTRDEIIDCIEQIKGSSDDHDYDKDVGRILKDLVEEELVAVDRTRYSMVGVSQSRSAMLKPSTQIGQCMQVAADGASTAGIGATTVGAEATNSKTAKR